tara:strand:+ start:96 stop:830 length:735 start_codon:yes stop_codon:yes gene_type:complete
MGLFSWMPGADLDSVAEREIADLNSKRTGSKDRVGAWNWQDDLGAWMAGSNKAGVLQRAKEKEDAKLKEIYDSKFKYIQSELGHLDPLYKGVDGVSKVDLDSQLFSDAKRAQTLANVVAENPDININNLPANVTASGIQGAGIRATQDKLKAEKDIERGRRDARVARIEAETARQFNNNLALQRRQIEANISARQENIDLSRLKLQMDQNRYMYEADTRRQDIREQRIAALTEALAGLGAAFVI